MNGAAPLTGAYDFGHAGRPVELHRGALGLPTGRRRLGRVWLTLDGELDIRWKVDRRGSFGLGEMLVRLDRPDIGSVEVPIVTTNSAGRGTVEHIELKRRGAELDRVLAHWINVPSILPAKPLAADDHVWLGRWECGAVGWILTLDRRPDHGDVTDKLEERRVFAVTHVGELRRHDHSSFTPDDAAQALYGFQTALSFALGRWVAPALPVGFDSAGCRAWEQWARWRCDSYTGFRGWWDHHTGDDLVEFVARFMEAWSDGTKHAVVRHFAHHVISANHKGTTLEGRIMLAQAGVEYLAWNVLVLSGRQTRKQYRSDNADDHLRQLLVLASIPTDIPNELAALKAHSAAQGLDGPASAIWLRNRLVHPKDAEEPYMIDNLIVEAWQLSMHYAQLLLLQRIGYRGSYVPPFPPGRFAHDHEPVPWT